MNRSNKTDDALFEGIRTRCQRDQWYGPELIGPKWRKKHVLPDDPRHFGFAYPPVSRELLERTESALGFALPPLLRNLYVQVANGGFGPGLGIQGVLEGYGRRGDSIYRDSDDTIVTHYKGRSHGRTVDLNEYKDQWSKYDNLALPYDIWPDKLLPLCDLGCVQHACIASDEQMYIVAPSENNEEYILVRLSISFEKWLWGWVKDDINTVYYGRDTEQKRAV